MANRMGPELDTKVERALRRLQDALPLHRHLGELDDDDRLAYQRILCDFAHFGHPQSSLASVERELLERLAALQLIVLDTTGGIRGAYPFTTEQRMHRVCLFGNDTHAMCALDALAPAAMFATKARIRSRCAVTDMPIEIHLQGTTLLNPETTAAVHFGMDWQSACAASCCADTLCTEMLFLQDADTARNWQEQRADSRELFTLDQAIAFADAFFTPLLPTGRNVGENRPCRTVRAAR